MALEQSLTHKGATFALGYHRVREVRIRNYLNGPEVLVTLDSYADVAARNSNQDGNVLASASFTVRNGADPLKDPQDLRDYFKASVTGRPYDVPMAQAYAYIKARGGYAAARDV